MRRSSLLSLIAAEAIAKSEIPIKSKMSDSLILIDLENLVSMLESTSNKICENCPATELSFQINIFETTKEKAYKEIIDQIDNATTESSQKAVSDLIDKYNKFAIESQKSWPDQAKKVYEFLKNDTINKSNTASKKIYYQKEDLDYKLKNLKELAIFISSNKVKNLSINGEDPLEFLSKISNIFQDLESWVEENTEHVMDDLLEKLSEESIQEIKERMMIKGKNRSDDVNPLSGLCGSGDCRLL